MPKKSTADLLLDAQVTWLISKLSGEALALTITEEVDALLDIGTRVRVGELVAPHDVHALVAKLFETVPASAGGSTLVAMAADVVYDRSAERFALVDVIDKDSVERITDEVQGAAPLPAQQNQGDHHRAVPGRRAGVEDRPAELIPAPAGRRHSAAPAGPAPPTEAVSSRMRRAGGAAPRPGFLRPPPRPWAAQATSWSSMR